MTGRETEARNRVSWRGLRGCGLRAGESECPSRPGFALQIILVSSSLSDGKQNLFLSTDEGNSFRKQVIPFSAEKLIFHPEEEDKVLVTTKDSKVSQRQAGLWSSHCSSGEWRPWAGRQEPGVGDTGPSITFSPRPMWSRHQIVGAALGCRCEN